MFESTFVCFTKYNFPVAKFMIFIMFDVAKNVQR